LGAITRGSNWRFMNEIRRKMQYRLHGRKRIMKDDASSRKRYSGGESQRTQKVLIGSFAVFRGNNWGPEVRVLRALNWWGSRKLERGDWRQGQTEINY